MELNDFQKGLERAQEKDAFHIRFHKLLCEWHGTNAPLNEEELALMDFYFSEGLTAEQAFRKYRHA